MESTYQTLFLKLANKIFRQGHYYRKQARILRSKAEREQDRDFALELSGEADQLDKSASDMEFIVEKATATDVVSDDDRDVIQTLKTV